MRCLKHLSSPACQRNQLWSLGWTWIFCPIPSTIPYWKAQSRQSGKTILRTIIRRTSSKVRDFTWFTEILPKSFILYKLFREPGTGRMLFVKYLPLSHVPSPDYSKMGMGLILQQKRCSISQHAVRKDGNWCLLAAISVTQLRQTIHNWGWGYSCC